MSLRIKDVAFDDFRSYEHFHLSDIGPLTVLVGPNAVGKTNVVEGIQLLTAQTSFRNPTGVQLVREGAAFARLRATAADENRLLELGLTIEAGKRRFILNGKQKRTADLKGVIPSVTFTPDDLNLAKGSGTTRRNALDAVGSQLSRNHYLIRRDFDKVLRHKNSLLKDEASPLLLESLNDLMVTCGAQLVCYRAALFGKLAASMSSYYAEIVGNRETLSARYAPSWLAEGEWLDARESIATRLANVSPRLLRRRWRKSVPAIVRWWDLMPTASSSSSKGARWACMEARASSARRCWRSNWRKSRLSATFWASSRCCCLTT